MPSLTLRHHRLLIDGRDVAPVELAVGRWARARGLLGRDHLDGAMLLTRTSSVHTIGMRFPIDIALCTTSLEVIAVTRLVAGRATLPRRGARAVLEAEAGAFERWGLRSGVLLSVGEPPSPPVR